MKSAKFLPLLCAVALGACAKDRRTDLDRAQVEGDRPPATVAGELRISGPHTHENLSVYLVHAENPAAERQFLTLSEALQQKKVRIHETGNVNELAIENLSDHEEIFIQSGDIVRGGKQDRVLGVDLILEAGSGKVPIASFCVEQGRWRQRGGESLALFSSSSNMAFSNDLRLAIKKDADQSEVWRNVRDLQARLASNLEAEVASPASKSSLELTLENDAVKKTTRQYTVALAGAPEKDPDVVGIVVAVNGEIYSADIYSSRALFHKLWPKLLESAAVEAVASKRDANSSDLPSVSAVEEFLRALPDESITTRTVSPRIRMTTREAPNVVVFETFDSKRGGECLHRNYVLKADEK